MRPTDSGGGGTGNVVPRSRRDRQLIRLALSGFRNNVPNADKRLRRAVRATRRSAAAGTLNKRDKKLARKLIREVKSGDSSHPMTGTSDTSLAAARRLRGIVGFNRSHATSPGSVPKPGGNNAGAGNNTGGGRRGGGRRRGGGGKVKYTPGVYNEDQSLGAQARSIVAGETRSQNNVLRREVRQNIRGRQNEILGLRNQGQRERGDLRYIFGEVGDYVDAQNAKINQGYDTTKSRASGFYDEMGARNAQSTNANRSAMLEEMARLGIGQSGEGNFEEDANASAAMGNTNRSNALTNLSMAQEGANTIGNLLASSVQGEQASAIGKSMNRQGDAITKARNDWAGQNEDLRQQILDNRLNKPNAIQQLLMTLQDRDYSRYAEQNQQNFLNGMAVNNFNLSKDQFNAQQGWQRQQVIAQRARAKAYRRQARRANQADTVAGYGAGIGNTVGDIFGGIFGGP